MSHPRFLILSCFWLLAAWSAQAAEFFVAPQGNDRHPGTAKKPFATLERAQQAVRALPADLDEEIIVTLRQGTYFLDRTLEFDARDSGRKGNPVVWRSCPGEKAMISGGVAVAGWQPIGEGRFSAAAPLDDFRRLTVHNQPAVRARTPNKDSYYRLKLWDLRRREVVVENGDIGDWQNLRDIEFIVQLHWAQSILKIDSLQRDRRYAYLTLQDPARDLLFRRDYPPKDENEPYHLENAIEFLDEPGEWYLDRRQKQLIYWPRPGETLDDRSVLAPRLETLIRVQGTADKPVVDLEFRDLVFSHTTWLRPSQQGLLNVQAGQYTVEPTINNTQFAERPPAAVEVNFAHRTCWTGNGFFDLAATGLDLHKGTQNTRVQGNLFAEIGGNGICVGVFTEPGLQLHTPYLPEDEREICVADSLLDNRIVRVAQDYPGCCGIACGAPRQITIAHNKVSDLPYTGISVGWAWTQKPSAMRGNRIYRNHIHHVLQLLCDGGGIYTLSLQPDSWIGENHIHHIQRSPWAVGSLNNGLFLDEGSSGFTVERNVFHYIEQGAIRHNRTGAITVIQNHVQDAALIEQAGPRALFQRRLAELNRLLKVE